MNKVELEAKVDALQDEINFLRAVYEAVSSNRLCLANKYYIAYCFVKACNLQIDWSMFAGTP